MHSQLNCDPGRGWTDIEGNLLNDATESVVITCEKSELEKIRLRFTRFTNNFSQMQCKICEWLFKCCSCAGGLRVCYSCEIYHWNNTISRHSIEIPYIYEGFQCCERSHSYNYKMWSAVAKRRKNNYRISTPTRIRTYENAAKISSFCRFINWIQQIHLISVLLRINLFWADFGAAMTLVHFLFFNP